MNRGEHYQIAEILLSHAETIANPTGDTEHDQLVARAQVHAMLANTSSEVYDTVLDLQANFANREHLLDVYEHRTGDDD